MNKIMLFLLAGIIFPVCANAQIGKIMTEFQGKNCVTVTHLDKSLYGLYKKKNISPEAENLLKQLDEVNILNLDLQQCGKNMEKEVSEKFDKILNSGKYKLIKSLSSTDKKQMIYAQTDGEQISNLVVSSQTPERMDIIEISGKIQAENIALLSKTLNIKGIGSLSALSGGNDSYTGNYFYYQIPDNYARTMEKKAREIEKKAREMEKRAQEMARKYESLHFDQLYQSLDSISHFNMLDDMFSVFNGDNFNFNFDMDWPETTSIMSNSVQISEENGKTKIKIDSQNSDMTYVIDGKEISKDNLEMPEKISKVNVVPSKKDIKKSYLLITSGNKLGSFTSYQDKVLTFKYDSQEYRYNLDKAQGTVLLINGSPSSSFSITPENILQIRPVSKIEKETGYYPDKSEVIVNTVATQNPQSGSFYPGQKATLNSVGKMSMGSKEVLYVVDGKKMPDNFDIHEIPEETISNISITKKAEEILQYGEGEKDGVIIITTKKKRRN